MYTYEIFKTKDGYGFNILSDGAVIVSQDFKPGVEGFVSMNEEDAMAEAAIILESMEE